MYKLSPRAFLIVISTTTIAVMSVLTLLPHDPYIRFQQLSTESLHYMRVKWIYERIHFDQTPIDVAFIGTSHTQSGIDDARVEERLNELGLGLHVVNFAVPHLGRDLEFVVARELLTHRQIRTLVIELQQAEARTPHPGFEKLATASDILGAPLFLNTTLVQSLIRLPLREVKLALATVIPESWNLQPSFDPSNYEGPHWNDTYLAHGFSVSRTRQKDREYFKSELRDLHDDLNKKEQLAQYFDRLPTRFNLLYRYNELYLHRIIHLAREKNVRVVFLYLPFLDEEQLPRGINSLESFGPLLDSRHLLEYPGYWQNADHLNFYGAQVLSNWIADELVRM